MKTQKDSFILDRFKSLGYAWKGVKLLVRSENSIKLQLGVGAFVTVLGLYVGLSFVEWTLQCLSIFLVLSAEGLNTAIEKIADFVHPKYHHKIGEIKDISAGAVTFIAFGAVIVGLLIYVPKFVV